jgi:hypothetical protein
MKFYNNRVSKRETEEDKKIFISGGFFQKVIAIYMRYHSRFIKSAAFSPAIKIKEILKFTKRV